jgi:regulator of replication initiation timing
MKVDRKRANQSRERQARSHRSTDIADLRQRIADEVAGTERVVAALGRDLAQHRRENRALARDRDHLRERLAQAEVTKLEQANTESLWRASLRDRQGVEDSLRALDEENRKLRERCAELERDLAHERQRSEVAALEVACLAEQIEELETIIALLSPVSETDKS